VIGQHAQNIVVLLSCDRPDVDLDMSNARSALATCSSLDRHKCAYSRFTCSTLLRLTSPCFTLLHFASLYFGSRHLSKALPLRHWLPRWQSQFLLRSQLRLPLPTRQIFLAPGYSINVTAHQQSRNDGDNTPSKAHEVYQTLFFDTRESIYSHYVGTTYEKRLTSLSDRHPRSATLSTPTSSLHGLGSLLLHANPSGSLMMP
jgi:hypothetical protein